MLGPRSKTEELCPSDNRIFHHVGTQKEGMPGGLFSHSGSWSMRPGKIVKGSRCGKGAESRYWPAGFSEPISTRG